MANISFHNENIVLYKHKRYWVIDASYLNSIKEEISSLDFAHLEDEIRSKIFPYTDYPYAKFTPDKEIFEIKKIKKIDNSNIGIQNDAAFSIDSSIIIMVENSIFLDLIPKYDYYQLTDSFDEINISYWNNLIEQFGEYSLGLILATGNNDFDGGGIYIIEN